MGIRYYAYAFDGDMTDTALADPHAVVSRDPLADAFGLPHGFTSGNTDFRQGPPEEDMLYLDKTWNNLQRMTAPLSPDHEVRPAYRMFEGDVTLVDDGMSWHPWVRAIPPEDVPDIADDLDTITVADFVPHYSRCGGEDPESEAVGVFQFLDRTRHFVRGLERTGRGFVYLIG